MNSDPSAAIITRFPPSPTGVLHVGSYRTALYSWLYARQNNGTFVLRIEDTDKERSTPEFETNIYESLNWLGIEADDAYRQSDRSARHAEVLQQLIDNGQAYISKEEVKKEGQRAEVIRFKNPNEEVVFRDAVRGDVTFDTTDLGDFVIAKSMNEPLYHLAVVVDDYDSGITHVIRGEDHISNTPRHILIQKAIQAPRPIYAHIPLILATDKSKLSKRNGARAILEYRDEGFLPDAILNYMALLGWNPGTEQEIFSRDELLKEFSLERIHKGGAIFSEEKMRWINREHIKRLPVDTLHTFLREFLLRSPRLTEKKWKLTNEVFDRIVPIITERIETFKDATELLTSGELDYFFEAPTYPDAQALVWKKSTLEKAREHLSTVYNTLEGLPENAFEYDKLKESLWDYAEAEGKGDVLWPLRYALSGKEKSPDPFTLTEALGKTETLTRVKNAQQKLDSAL
ncbi:MAG: glutamate--tRNA ligase [Candidatus Paceibacterota bacterium]